MKKIMIDNRNRNAKIIAFALVAVLLLIGTVGLASASAAVTTFRGGGLIAYYPFNGDAKDKSGNGNDGTVYGATWVDNGDCGKALSFDGRDNYVEVPLSPELTMTTNSFTVEAWVKTSDSPSKNDCIVGNYRTSTTPHWTLAHLGETAKSRGKFEFGIRDANGDGAVIETLNPMNDGSWHHLVGVRDAAQGRIQFYVDGILIGNVPATTGNVNSGQSIWIGEHLYRYFNGIIDEVRIYNYAKTQSQIQEDMRKCTPSTPTATAGPTPTTSAPAPTLETPTDTPSITECDSTARAIINAVGGCDALDRSRYPAIYEACCSKITKEYLLDLLNAALTDDGKITSDEKKQLLDALNAYLELRP